MKVKGVLDTCFLNFFLVESSSISVPVFSLVNQVFQSILTTQFILNFPVYGIVTIVCNGNLSFESVIWLWSNPSLLMKQTSC